MSVTSEEKLITKLENTAYREAYVREHVKTSVPLQIRHLREQRELTQAELAEQATTTQTVISRLEDPNYGNLTLNSLLRIAAALDIGLLVKFVPFSRLLAEFQDLSPQALSVESFTEELSTLKAWAVRAKDTTLQPRSENRIIELVASHYPTPACSVAGVDQWGEIQAYQFPYQFPTLVATTRNATINIASGQVAASGAICVSDDNDQGKISIGSTYPAAIASHYDVPHRGTLGLFDLRQEGIRYGRSAS